MKALKKEMRFVINTIFINIKIIVLFGILGIFISLFNFFIPIDNMFKASSSVFITVLDDYDDTNTTRLITSFIDLFDSTQILNKIVDVLGNSISADELKNMTTLKKSTANTIVTVTVRNKNPAVAIETANAVSQILAIETAKFFQTPNNIKILDKATDIDYAYRGRTIHILISFLFAFLFLSCSCVYYIIKALSSDKVLFIEDCTMDGALEIIGVIPFAK